MPGEKILKSTARLGQIGMGSSDLSDPFLLEYKAYIELSKHRYSNLYLEKVLCMSIFSPITTTVHTAVPISLLTNGSSPV